MGRRGYDGAMKNSDTLPGRQYVSIPLGLTRLARLAVFSGFAGFAVLSLGACGRSNEKVDEPAAKVSQDAAPVASTVEEPAGAAPSAASLASPGSAPPKVLFVGDSLTAGLGVSVEEAFPARVGEILAAEGHPIQVINAGVSGDVSAGGVSRIDWLLRQKPAVVVVELGANDALRGQPLADLEKNLRAVVERSQAAGAKVLILGMRIPPNYGKDYADGFEAIFPRVAEATGSALVPFLLEGVGGEPELNQADGIHPTVEGHRILAKTVAPYLARVLESLGTLERK